MKLCKRILVIALVTFALQGCATYRYQAEGEILDPQGNSHDAVVYWYKQHIWFWDVEIEDSSMVLIACGLGNYTLFLDETGDAPFTELQADANERLVGRLSDDGNYQPLPAPEQETLTTGDTCGIVVLDGTARSVYELDENNAPGVMILCEAPSYGRTLPRAGSYAFKPVRLIEVDDVGQAPRTCHKASPEAGASP